MPCSTRDPGSKTEPGRHICQTPGRADLALAPISQRIYVNEVSVLLHSYLTKYQTQTYGTQN